MSQKRGFILGKINNFEFFEIVQIRPEKTILHFIQVFKILIFKRARSIFLFPIVKSCIAQIVMTFTYNLLYLRKHLSITAYGSIKQKNIKMSP